MVSHSQRTPLVAGVAMGAAFLAGLDLFVVNVAFDAIASDLGVGRPGGPSTAELSWILSGYAVVYAALLAGLAIITLIVKTLLEWWHGDEIKAKGH